MSKGSRPNRFAVLGDIQGSKALDDRPAIQSALQSALRDAERHVGGLVSPLQITGGDEFKGLLSSGRAALDLAAFIAERLAPVRILFGIGHGVLQVGAPGDLPGTMDGPVFHRARDALDEAKRRDHWLVLRGVGGRYGETVEGIVNAAYALTGKTRARWTATQRRYIRLVGEADTQKQAAARAGVSPSTISESLRSADWREVAELEERMKRLLDRFTETPDGH